MKKPNVAGVLSGCTASYISGGGRIRLQEYDVSEANSCGCGRSPTGKCVGWHKLTEEQYTEKKAAWEARQAEKEAKEAS